MFHSQPLPPKMFWLVRAVQPRVFSPKALRVAMRQGSWAATTKSIKRQMTLRQVGRFGAPVVHLDVDVVVIIAGPGRIVAVVPKTLQVGGKAAGTRTAGQQIAAVLEHRSPPDRDRPGPRHSASGGRRSARPAHPARSRRCPGRRGRAARTDPRCARSAGRRRTWPAPPPVPARPAAADRPRASRPVVGLVVGPGIQQQRQVVAFGEDEFLAIRRDSAARVQHRTAHACLSWLGISPAKKRPCSVARRRGLLARFQADPAGERAGFAGGVAKDHHLVGVAGKGLAGELHAVLG